MGVFSQKFRCDLKAERKCTCWMCGGLMVKGEPEVYFRNTVASSQCHTKCMLRDIIKYGNIPYDEIIAIYKEAVAEMI